MSISEEYKQLLETFNRTLGQARRYGVDYEYNPVKRPTRGSIRRLSKELEKLRTEIWFKKLDRERDKEADIIISNFERLVESMGDADYQLQHISFGAKSSSDARQPGIDAREDPIRDILDVLEEVIQSLGKVQVAENIKRAGERLERLIEELVFAIYRNKYSRYGGGRAAYTTAIQLEVKGILSGEY